jgi:phage N-6-adenine-methyltransferase
MSIHFSSKSIEWSTPQDLFDRLNAEFRFTLDAAANDHNAKCDRFFSIDNDALSQSWDGHTVWLNPPYGRGIGKFIEKAAIEGSNGATVVCLVPARTDTKWWAMFWDHKTHRPKKGCRVRFLPKRIRFQGMNKDAPFPCAIVIFRKKF